jgi:DNA invertase Pin-like site-specific DNA recombinase
MTKRKDPTLPSLHAPAGSFADGIEPNAIPPANHLIGTVRVSKLGGRGGEALMAPDIQEDVMRGWRDQNAPGCTIEFRRELDTSGGTVDRTVLEGALDDIFAGRADGLITASIDRYARTTDGLQAIRTLNQSGKTFVAVREHIGPEMTTTSFGWFTLTILLAIAELQLAQFTEQWLTVRRRHVAAGIANQTPYGYTKRSKDEVERPRRLDRNDETAPWVEYIYERRAAGQSWEGIVRELEAADVVSPKGGKRWLHSTVTDIVKNRAYLGELTSGEFINPKAWEPLVSVALWERANNVMTTAARADSESHLLTGLLRCATCGGRMNGYMQCRKGGDRWFYYRCRRRYSWGKCPKPASANLDELEAIVVAAFWQAHQEALEAVGVDSDEASADVRAAQEALDDAEADLRDFRDSPMTAKMKKKHGQSWVDEGMEARDLRVDDARDALTLALAAKRGTYVPVDLDVQWDELPVDEQRSYLSDTFGLIVVAPNMGWREPVAGRVRMWGRDEPGTPEVAGRGATGPTPIVI